MIPRSQATQPLNGRLEDNPLDEHRKAELNQILVLFYLAYRTFTDKPDQILSNYHLQRVHHRILFFVGHFPGLTIQQLLTVLEVSKQALHRPLKQLVELGLIRYTPAIHDKRSRLLTLTDAGQALEQELSGGQRQFLDQIFQTAGEGAEEAWVHIMAALSEKRPAFHFVEDLRRNTDE